MASVMILMLIGLKPQNVRVSDRTRWDRKTRGAQRAFFARKPLPPINERLYRIPTSQLSPRTARGIVLFSYRRTTRPASAFASTNELRIERRFEQGSRNIQL
ncbi:hypothetical protein PsYK624_108470 [Phanerochaete sordida]|uniref:Uncharacterized protein n=1 Tax=Phanerochaete sordida TaxID=48140 RepID=A0A9P3LGL4_9APHY|nr:hypothetical protein PsYK624_108470 [Phanerochaete sordida]